MISSPVCGRLLSNRRFNDFITPVWGRLLSNRRSYEFITPLWGRLPSNTRSYDSWLVFSVATDTFVRKLNWIMEREKTRRLESSSSVSCAVFACWVILLAGPSSAENAASINTGHEARERSTNKEVRDVKQRKCKT